MSEETKQNILDVDLIDQQGEPLFTVRPRYYENLRRGTRGTRASFKLIQKRNFKRAKSGISDKINEQLFASGGKTYADFLITSMSFGFAEKMQLTQVFGDHTVAYAFGASPVILNIQGVVTDDIDNDWFVKFIFLYKDFLRGTQMARNFDLAQLATHNAVYDGVIMSINMSQDSSNDTLVQFQMQFLVRSFEFFSAQQFREDTVTNTSAEDLQKSIDGSFSYKDIKDTSLKAKLAAARSNAVNGARDAIAATGYASVTNALSRGPDSLLNSPLNGDSDSASLPSTITPASRNSDGSATLGNYSAAFGRVSSTVGNTSGGVDRFFNKIFKKIDKVDASLLRLQVVGVYADTVSTINTKVETLGGFLNSVKRNMETLNQKLSYARNPFSDLTDAIAGAREQVRTFTEIVNLVKQTNQLLRRKIDIFAELNAELAGLKSDLKNAKGSVSAMSTSTSNKLSVSMRSSGEDGLPFLGNSGAGISAADAAAKLKAMNYVGLEEVSTLPTPLPDYRSNADPRASLTF